MVLLDTVAPTLEPAKHFPRQMHPADVKKPFLVAGRLLDPAGSQTYNFKFRKTLSHQGVAEDGKVHLDFEIGDDVGNKRWVHWALALSETAPQRGDNIDYYLQAGRY